MKQTLFFALLSAWSLFACTKDPVIVNPPDDTPIDTVPIDTVRHVIALGKGAMLKNGETWGGTFEAKTPYNGSSERFDLRTKLGNEYTLSQSLRITDIPRKVGKYSVELFHFQNYYNGIPEAAFILTLEGDQPIGDYLIDTLRHDHYVEVLRYDSVNQVVEGTFQLFLLKQPLPNASNWTNPPQSIDLTEGKFHLKIQQ